MAETVASLGDCRRGGRQAAPRKVQVGPAYRAVPGFDSVKRMWPCLDWFDSIRRATTRPANDLIVLSPSSHHLLCGRIIFA
jgi:hypothetical protein